MKRSNFTFLFLFALLSFASTSTWAQSGLGTACSKQVNVAVGADCSFVLTDLDLGNAANMADFIQVYADGAEPESGSGAAAATGAGAFTTMYTFTDHSLGKGKHIYELRDGGYTGDVICWGYLHLEHKTIPPPDGDKYYVDCLWESSFRWPRYTFPSGCYAWPKEGTSPVTTILEIEGTCDTTTYVRTVTETFEFAHGGKDTYVVRQDTLCVYGLKKPDICWPPNWIEVECDILPDDYDADDHDAISEMLSPSNLLSYFARNRVAGRDTLVAPYVKKEVVVEQDTVVYCIEEAKMWDGVTTELVQVETKDGGYVWTEVEVHDWVCVKTDTLWLDDCDDFDRLWYPCTQVTTGTPVLGYPSCTSLPDYYYCGGTKVDTVPGYAPFPKGNTCNINVKCTDWVVEGQCEGLPVVMRNWEIVDWCDPTKSVWDSVQWIKVTDTEAPVFNERIGDQWASIAPWTCAGEVYVQPWVSDWGWIDYTYELSEGYAVVGSDGGATIGGLWKDACPVYAKVTARDKCGNVSYDEFYIYITDDVAPVVITEDEINVTLSGDHESTGGVAKVYKESIDAGSHDAGCGEVETCVLLKEELDNPAFFPAGTFWSRSSTRTNVTQVVYSGDFGSFTGGYVPTQCESDDTFYIYTANKNGALTLIGSIDVVYCKDYVKFCCEDAGATHQVALVASDNAGDHDCVPSGHSVSDNSAYGWTNVTVEDKSSIFVECNSIAIDCADYSGALPPPRAWNICEEITLTDYVDSGDIDACGDGRITRQWFYNGNFVCAQFIFGDDGGQFNPYTIKWPVHYDGGTTFGAYRECEHLDFNGDFAGDFFSNGVAVTGVVEYGGNVDHGDYFECEAGDVVAEPEWCNVQCSLVGYNYEDEELEVDDACKKIVRRHTVIDWCTWDPNGDSSYGDDENDTANDQFQIVNDVWLPGPVSADKIGGTPGIPHDSKDSYPSCTDCPKPSRTSDRLTTYFRYTDVDEDGYYTFDQIIKIIDNTDPVIDAPAEEAVSVTGGNGTKLPDDYDESVFDDCIGGGTVAASASDFCLDSENDASSLRWWIERQVPAAKGGWTTVATKGEVGASATMGTGFQGPGGVARIFWQVTDACGNVATAYTSLSFADEKKPTPVCLESISSSTMNVDGGPVAIWAKDFDLGSFDNCSAVDVMFAVDADGNLWNNEVGVTGAEAAAAGYSFVPSAEVGCDDIANGVRAVIETGLFVFDEAGNYDFCYITFRVDDNANVCEDVDTGAAAITGEVRTELGDMIESAEVSLNKAFVDMTSVDGKYAFGNNPEYDTYSITSKKDDDYLNGVTTLDLVLIQKHVLGIEALDSPYKVIAADVNSDANISAIDLVELRKLILGVYNELPSNDSWRFVDASETFADANDPFPFTEALNIAELNGDALNQDFLGVKIGDVSGNAIANSLIAAGTRSAGTLSLEIADATVAAGEEVSVAVTAANFTDIAAYQFTMDVNGLEFTGVESGAINVSAENFGLLDANTITTAWNSTAGVSASDVLFTMNFRATDGVTLSNAINVSSRVTTAAAYTSGADQLDIQVSFNGIASNDFALYQNEPNPFESVTRIAFELPEASAATLTVFDVTGKVVSIVRGDFAQGANTITLDKSDLNASGVLYYQLESGEFTATKKMIVIE